MQRFYETVIDTLTGAAVSGAQVWVLHPDGSLATLWQDALATVPAANPIVSDGNGFVQCYAPDGIYTLDFRVGGFSLRSIEGVPIFDLLDMRADVDDLLARMTTAEAGIVTLTTNLAAESAARIAADAAEATTRGNADTALANAIAALDADTYSKAETDALLALKLNAAAVSAFGLGLIDDADAATARGTLGLGTMAVATAANYYTSVAADALLAGKLSTGLAALKASNLSDLASAGTARTNLSVYSKAEVDAAVAGSGGSRWTVVDDFTLSGAIASHDVDVSVYDEIRCIFNAVTGSLVSSRGIQVSVDGGVTFYSTSGNYLLIPSNGLTSNQTQITAHSTSASAAKTGVITLHGIRYTGIKVMDSIDTVDGTSYLFVGSTSAITHVRFMTSSGNLAAGRLITLGR